MPHFWNGKYNLWKQIKCSFFFKHLFNFTHKSMAIISRIINSLDVIFNKQLLDSDSIIRQLYVINSDEKRGEFIHCPPKTSLPVCDQNCQFFLTPSLCLGNVFFAGATSDILLVFHLIVL
jgi:hypothetical protein